MTFITAGKSTTLPLLLLSGGGRKSRYALLNNLLASFEQKSIAVLILDYYNDLAGSSSTSATFISGQADHFIPAGCFKSDADWQNWLLAGGYGSVSTFAYKYDLILAVSQSQGDEDIKLQVIGENCFKPYLVHQPDDDINQLVASIIHWLDQRLLEVPVWGCLLIGGGSRRMGHPKHLIKDAKGITWLENLAARMTDVSNGIVLSGKGEVPSSLSGLVRLEDIKEAQGPLAGLLAAMRWNPDVSWLVAACDMPLVQPNAFEWLLGTRKAGSWGSVPHHPQTDRFEPLLAHYDFRCRDLLEAMVRQRNLRMSAIGEQPKIATPTVPQELTVSWRNCNTPEDLAGLD